MSIWKPQPAESIKVKQFRQIFFWPLTLADPPVKRVGEDVAKVRASLKDTAWKPADPWTVQPDNNFGGPYEEFVYFHDFVQRFLYDRREDGPISLFHRTDIRTLKATINGEIYSFNVELLTLHLFETGTAVLTLELVHEQEGDEKISLAQAQTTADQLRRAFPGFWQDGAAGFCPSDVTLCTPCGRAVTLPDASRGRLHATDWAHKNSTARVFPWWRALVAPLQLDGEIKVGPRWRHVLDERLPTMTYISLSEACSSLSGASGGSAADDFALVSPGDWMRLAQADGAGSDLAPANMAFLEEAVGREAFYDRFFPGEGMHPDTATRFAFLGYHFLAVGAGWFFDNILREHFRRHYRQMAFVAHLEFASLLALSSRVTKLVDETSKHKDKEPDRFRNGLLAIEEDFLDFTHRYRFTNVSNHVQAREMFERMRKTLGLAELYDDVKEEIKTAAELAVALDQCESARAATRLTRLATLGLPAGLAVGAGGMNLLVGSEAPNVAWIPDDGAAGLWRAQVLQFALLLSVFYGLGWAALSLIVHDEGKEAARLRGVTLGLAVAAAIAALALVASFLAGSPTAGGG
ncbi:hypothetical protein [Afifella aestuarii]|uniref:hypothetical protein n=1 Tax=Afifella aestuarii TaxID=1909496 RepID=UPI000FE367AF|nr:hypothetical protein [Afifella aestuarii]